MAIPGQTLSIRDPGLGVAPEAINSFVFLGTSQKGLVNTLYAFSAVSDVIDELGQGPLAEDLAYFLMVAGGPVYAVPLNSTVLGVAGTPTKVPAGTSSGTVAVAGEPLDAYELVVRCTKSGGLGEGEFAYSLDDGRTFSEIMIIPTGGGYPIPSSGLTITFAVGASPTSPPFAEGDEWKATCTAPGFNTTDLAAGISALLASSIEFAGVVLSGEFPTSSAGATVAGAMSLHMESLFQQYRFARALMDSGTDPAATTITSYASVSSSRLSVAYGDCELVSGKPGAGWGVPRRSNVTAVAARAGASLISTDLARVADGPLAGVNDISHDEFRTELMDQKKFTTLRTWQGRAGFYICNARLMSPAGSDFVYWQHGRCMDTACDTTAKTQQPLINSSLRTTPEGRVNPADADRWRERVLDALRVNLIDPDSAEGTPGHVSAVDYQVDKLVNVMNGNIKTQVSIRPLTYGKQITTELGFSIDVGGTP